MLYFIQRDTTNGVDLKMSYYNKISSTSTQDSLGGFSEGLVSFLKSIVKQSMEEVIKDKMYENVVLDQKLTTQQLCERWNISKNTLHTWEDKGIISPIQTGGRKKIYSLKDVRDVEVNGYVKGICRC